MRLRMVLGAPLNNGHEPKPCVVYIWNGQLFSLSVHARETGPLFPELSHTQRNNVCIELIVQWEDSVEGGSLKFTAGVHFETTDNQLTKSISTALKVFVQGVEAFHRESNGSILLNPRVSCEDSASTSSRWAQGEQLFKWVYGFHVYIWALFPADEPTVFFVLDETPIRSLILKWNYSPAHYSFPWRFISRLSSSNSFVVLFVA